MLHIGDQIIDVFEPRVHPKAGARVGPASRAAQVERIEWNRQALEATPGRADAVQLERVDQRIARLAFHRLQYHAEQAAGAAEIAFPQGVTRIAFERPEGGAIMLPVILSAWAHGRRTPPLLGVDWPAIWNKPLADVRTFLSVTPYVSPFPADLFEQLSVAA